MFHWFTSTPCPLFYFNSLSIVLLQLLVYLLLYFLLLLSFSISIDEDYVPKALVFLFVLYVLSYRWVHFSTAVLFWQSLEVGAGKRCWECGETIVDLATDCRHHNDCFIKTGSDDSHFNVWSIVRGKVTKTVPKDHTLWIEERRIRIEPRSFCLPA